MSLSGQKDFPPLSQSRIALSRGGGGGHVGVSRVVTAHLAFVR